MCRSQSQWGKPGVAERGEASIQNLDVVGRSGANERVEGLQRLVQRRQLLAE